MELHNIDLRDEYYDKIHSMKPKWWMQWGVLTVFLILVIIFSLGYVVQYPDVIYSEFRLTTNKPSITLPLSSGSQIERIFVENRDSIRVGTHLLIIKNNSKYQDVLFLERALNNFTFSKDSIVHFFDRFLNYDLQLGDIIENDWVAFSSALLEYYKIKALDTYQAKIKFLKSELHEQYQLQKHYTKLLQTDYLHKGLLDKKIETDSILWKDGVISKMAYNKNKQDYLNNYKSLQQNNLALKQINLEIIKLENAIKNFENSEKESLLIHRLDMRKSLNNLKASIASWKKNYLLIAPIGGSVTFLQNLKEGEFFEGKVMVITPRDKSFYGNVNIPLVGAGKVEKGQKVILKLNDYPFREYGVLEGQLMDFSPVAGENYYLGKVEINKNSMSSYGKNIKIKENMSGVGEIITNDRNVLGRLFERVLYAFNR